MISNSSKDLRRSGHSALFCMWGDEAESEIVAGPEKPSKSVAELGLRTVSPDSQAGPRPLYHVPALHLSLFCPDGGPSSQPSLPGSHLSPKPHCPQPQDAMPAGFLAAPSVGFSSFSPSPCAPLAAPTRSCQLLPWAQSTTSFLSSSCLPTCWSLSVHCSLLQGTPTHPPKPSTDVPSSGNPLPTSPCSQAP